ncbi:MAG: citrate lyase subunit alpha [Deltaproteobacteria bacterium]|jgi:citrate lyase subunit alpha/citrate CoA-transferase|nr:citrate lyase subunit alpha [Deltaproteobacteria bacterium]
MINAIGRDIPQFVEGFGPVKKYQGAFKTLPEGASYGPPIKAARLGQSKLCHGLGDLFKSLKIESGMTFSFHHHLRNGDEVVNQVLATAESLGLKNISVSLTAAFATHAPMIEFIKKGVVTSLRTSGVYGPLAVALSNGILPTPVILHSHGGRPRSLRSGELKVDVAFIAAPTADDRGNLTGAIGKSACGSLGYAFPDADYATHVVAVTDNLVPYPLLPASIGQNKVDRVVLVESLGDPQGIVSGTTRITKDPVGLHIADTAAKVIEASGLLKNGFSFQTGAGGASLAAAHYVGRMMRAQNIKGSFALGGITGYMVDMLEEGLFGNLFDVQSFDLESVRSIGRNPNHVEVSSDLYANPFNGGSLVNDLDVVILGATEIDVDFNVNVITGSDGVLMGAAGGHPDTAAGAKMTVIVTTLLRSRLPIVVDRVITATTPGETVDVLVTEYGLAVNPARADLRDRFLAAGLPVKDIHELKNLAHKMAGIPQTMAFDGPIVGLVEYRDGTIIDVVRAPNL